MGRGTKLTVRACEELRKPFRVIVLDGPGLWSVPPDEIASWIEAAEINALNVAGPRESSAPGIGALAERYLLEVFAQIKRAGL